MFKKSPRRNIRLDLNVSKNKSLSNDRGLVVMLGMALVVVGIIGAFTADTFATNLRSNATTQKAFSKAVHVINSFSNCSGVQYLGADGACHDPAADGSTSFAALTDTPASYTAGSVLFTSGSAVSEDNANLFWDDTNDRLGIGVVSPAEQLDVAGNIRLAGGFTDDDFVGTALPFSDASNTNLDALISGSSVVGIFNEFAGDIDINLQNIDTNATNIQSLYDTVGAMSGDLITEGDSKVEVVDGGTGYLLFQTDGAEVARIDESGNLGLGVTDPAQQLEMSGAMELAHTTSSDTGVIYKGDERFLHNFSHPTGDTALPIGRNTFLGEMAGNFTMGSTATSINHGSYNNMIGYRSGSALTTGFYNNSLGAFSLYTNTTGVQNSAVGTNALRLNLSGSSNVGVGDSALYTNSAGHRNIALGAFAGYYETGSDKLYVSSLTTTQQVDEATGRTKAIIYGSQSSTTANQTLDLNAQVKATYGLEVGAITTATAGALQWDGSNFQGYDGSSWVNLDTQGGSAAGSDGAIQFASSGAFTADSTNLVWDDTNDRLGIGTGSPGSALHLNAGTGTIDTGLTFGDGDTGFYELSDDYLIINGSGTARWRITTTNMGSASADSGGFYHGAATAIKPTIVPAQNDSNTGIGKAGDDQLSLIAGGVEGQRISEGNGRASTIMSGTVVETITDGSTTASAATLTMTGENFLTTVSVGDAVVVHGGTAAADYGTYIVRSVDSDTQITVDRNFTVTNTDVDFDIISKGVVVENSTQDGVSNIHANKLVLDQAGTHGTTTGIWFGANNSGIYENAAGQFTIDVAGSSSWFYDTTIFRGTNGAGAGIRNIATSATTPTILPARNDLDTGLGVAGVGNQLSLIAGGVEGIRVNATAAHSVAGITDYETLVLADDDIPNKKYVDDAVSASSTPASGVAGAIQFSDGSGFASDATNLFWDDTNDLLGVGTNTPGHLVDIYQDGSADLLRVTGTGDIVTFGRVGTYGFTYNSSNQRTTMYQGEFGAGGMSSSSATLSGSLIFSNNNVKLFRDTNGLQVDSYEDVSFYSTQDAVELFRINRTAAHSVAGITDYETLVLADDDIPNKKYVDDAVSASSTPASGVAGAIQFSDGSAFASDATNLFWDDTNDRLGIGTATPGSALHLNAGTGLNTGIAFGDGDTMILEGEDDQLRVYAGGVNTVQFMSARMNALVPIGRSTAGYPNLVSEQSSDTNPGYTFATDVDTGVGRRGKDQLSLIAGEIEAIRSSEGNSRTSSVLSGQVVETIINASTSASAATLTKAGENFLTSVSVGDAVIVYDGLTDVDYGTYIVQSVDSDSQLTVDRNFTATNVNVAFDVISKGVVIENSTQDGVANIHANAIYLDEGDVADQTSGIIFNSDQSAGIFSTPGSSAISFYSTAGANRFAVTHQFMGSVEVNKGSFRHIAATATAPSIVPRNNDLDTGIGSASTGGDQLSLIAGGVEGIRVNATAAHSVAGITDYETLVLADDDIPNKKYVDDAITAGTGIAIGDAVTSSTAGSVLFADASGNLGQDNANLFWDDTNNRLGIGIAVPTSELHVAGDINATGSVSFATTGTLNSAGLFNAVSTGFRIGNTNATLGGIHMQMNNVDTAVFEREGGLLLDPAGSFDLAHGLKFGDGDTGFYESADDDLHYYSGDSYVAKMNVNGIYVGNNGPLLYRGTTSSTVPVHAFVTDVNTGLGLAAPDQLSLIAGNIEIARLTQNDAADDELLVNGNISLTGSLFDSFVTVGIPLGESGETALSGFTATSIVGALNEVGSDIATNAANIATNASNITDIYSTLSGNLNTVSNMSSQGILQSNASGVVSTSLTLPDGVLATTQSANDNSTKVATTAYVDSAMGAVSADQIIEGDTKVETIDTGSDGHIVFETDGTEVARIDESGNLGIGVTDPDEKLEVAGAVHLGQTTAPTTTTDKLYNVGGDLFWNGSQLGGTPTAIADSAGTTYVTTSETTNVITAKSANTGTSSMMEWQKGDSTLAAKIDGNMDFSFYNDSDHYTTINGNNITLTGDGAVGNYIYGSAGSFHRFPVNNGQQYHSLQAGTGATQILNLISGDGLYSYEGWSFQDRDLKTMGTVNRSLLSYSMSASGGYVRLGSSELVSGSFASMDTQILATAARPGSSLYPGGDIFIEAGEANLDGGRAGYVLLAENWGNVGIGVSDPDEKLEVAGVVHLGQTTAPTTTTDKLYNVGGDLFWNGTQLATGSTGISIGDAVTSSTAGSILFADGSGDLGQDNANLFWDDTNDRLGVGVTDPSQQLELTESIELPNTSSATTGVVYKNGVRFMHDFSHPTGDTVVPEGLNVYLGQSAGNFTSGSTATDIIQGSRNVGIGAAALSQSTTGYRNVAIGSGSLDALTAGAQNVAIGSDAMGASITGSNNVAIGQQALQGNTSGLSNVGVGVNTGSSNNGTANIFLGFSAGSYETGSNKLYIASIGAGAQVDEATGRTTSIIYGEQSATTADQTLALNAQVKATYGLEVGAITTATAGAIQWDGSNFQGYDGSAWVDLDSQGITGVAIGDAVTSSTAGSILFADASGDLGQDNANLFWDDTNDRLGLGVTDPAQQLELAGSIELANTSSASAGVIYKNGARFLHDFVDPTGDTAVPIGANLFLGINSGNFTVGSTATATYEGSQNIGVGDNTFGSLTTGFRNTAVGVAAMTSLTTGSQNVAQGYHAMRFNQTGSLNIGIGSMSMYNKTSGANNVAIGANAGTSNVSGSKNIFLGDSAGYHETGSDTLMLSSIGIVAQTDEATARTMALMYGVQSETTANQTLALNAQVKATYGLEVGAITTATAGAIQWDGSNFQGYDGSAWVDLDSQGITGVAIGDAVTSSTAGSILFADASGDLGQDNANLFWDDTNDRLGLGVTDPTQQLELTGAIELAKTTSSTTGVIYKDGVSFLHNFSHPTGDTAVPSGGNVFLGEASGNFTLGATATTSIQASENIGVGKFVLDGLTTGYRNIALGRSALGSVNSGNSNIGIGYQNSMQLGAGSHNISLGENALLNLITGSFNLSIGNSSGYSSSGDRNIFLGSYAGFYETGSDKLYISSLSNSVQTDEATARTKSIIYGVQNGTTTANQTLALNAQVKATYGLEVGAITTATAGAIQWDGSNFQGYDGSAWVDLDSQGITGIAIGDAVTSSTTGSILFADGSGDLGQDNANLFWDDTNNELGIGGVTAPDGKVHVVADADETLGVGVTTCSAGYTWTIDADGSGTLNEGDKCSKGAIVVEGNILPEMTGATEDVPSSGDFFVSQRTIGGPDNWFKALYVQDLHLGQNSLYMNGEAVLSNDSAQLEFKATTDQDMIVSTQGINGELTLNSDSAIGIAVSSQNTGKNVNITNASANGNVILSSNGTNGQVQLSAADEIDLTAATIDLNGSVSLPTLTLPEQGSDPGILDANGKLYTKNDGGTTKLYFMNDIGGVETISGTGISGTAGTFAKFNPAGDNLVDAQLSENGSGQVMIGDTSNLSALSGLNVNGRAMFFRENNDGAFTIARYDETPTNADVLGSFEIGLDNGTAYESYAQISGVLENSATIDGSLLFRVKKNNAWDDAMVLSEDGYLGLGVADPENNLHVSTTTAGGGLSLSGSVSPGLRLYDGDVVGSSTYYGQNILVLAANDGVAGTTIGDYLIANKKNFNLHLGTNNTIRQTITGGGNIGFGVTDPDEQLEMTGRIHLGQTTAPATTTDKLYNVGGNLFWNGTAVATGSSGISIGDGVTSSTAGSILFADSSGNLGQDNANLFWDDTNDRLGLGEAVPLSTLHVNGGVGALDTGLTFGDGDSGVYETVDDQLSISIAGSERYRIAASGITPTDVGSWNLRRTVASNTNPAFAFYLDDDTGLGRAAADQLSLIAGAVEMMRLSKTGTATTDQVVIAPGNTLGSATLPGLGFLDGNTGFTVTETTVGEIGFITKGVKRAFVNDNGFYVSTALMMRTTPTATQPVFTFGNDYNTGMGRAADDQLSLIAGGVEGIRVNAAAAHSVAGITDYETLVLADDDIPNKKYVDDAISAGTGVAIGDGVTSSTAGSILFADASGNLGQDNANLFWDDTNDRLGLGTGTPTAGLEVKASTSDGSDTFVVSDSTGASLVSVSDDGHVGIGVAAPTGGTTMSVLGAINASANFTTNGGFRAEQTQVLLPHPTVDTRIGNTSAAGFKLFANNIDGLLIDALTSPGAVRTVINPDGDLGADTGLWFGDGDTGFWENADDSVVITVGGGNSFFFNSTTLGGIGNPMGAIYARDATATVPTFTPYRSDSDTGIGHAAEDQLSLIAGSVEVIRLTQNDAATDVALVNGDISLTGNLVDTYVTAGIALGEAGETALSGFTATSIVGALNEVGTDIATNADNIDTNAVNITDIYSTLTGNVTTLAGFSSQGIVQSDGSGDISTSMTLPNGVLATTQSANDNSTKVATTAYVDSAMSGVSSDVISEGDTKVETIDTGIDGHIVFETDGVEAMRVDENGNLGIGTDTPTAKLSLVGGSIVIDSGASLYLDGSPGGVVDEGWAIGKDTSHHINITGNTSSEGREFRLLDYGNAAPKFSVDFFSGKTYMAGMAGIGVAPAAQIHGQGGVTEALTGTVSVTVNTAAVSGSGTAFDTELAVGDTIKISNQVFTVSAIADATNLTIDSNHTTGASAVTAYSDPDLLRLDNGDGVEKFAVDKSGILNIAQVEAPGTTTDKLYNVAGNLFWNGQDLTETGIVDQILEGDTKVETIDTGIDGNIVFETDGAEAMRIDENQDVSMTSGLSLANANIDFTTDNISFTNQTVSTTQRINGHGGTYIEAPNANGGNPWTLSGKSGANMLYIAEAGAHKWVFDADQIKNSAGENIVQYVPRGVSKGSVTIGDSAGSASIAAADLYLYANNARSGGAHIGGDIYIEPGTDGGGTGRAGYVLMAQGSGKNVGIGVSAPDEKLHVDGAVHLEQVTAPTTTTDKLYNVAGNLFWNGSELGGGDATVWSGTTANSTPAEIFVGGVASSRVSVAANSVKGFTIQVVARDNTSGDAAVYYFKGAIKRDGSDNTSFVGTVTKEIMGEDDTSWDVVLGADDTNEALTITVTGDATNTVGWAAKATFTEYAF